MVDASDPAVAKRLFSRAFRIAGTVPLPSGCDESRLLAHVLADLLGRGCLARLADDGVIVEGRSDGRGSVLGFVDAGRIRLARHGTARTLEYEFSTLGGLQLCAGLSVVAASLAWFALESPALTAFGLLAPLLWLYGANFVMTAVRVPALLERLCGSAPRVKPGPWR